MLVSFIIIAYNAGEKLNELLEDIKKQDYNHENIEIILVDGISEDNTRKVMEKFKGASNDFSRICVLDNYKRTLPCGWNIALKESRGDIILRVDAHTSIPKDFIKNNVKCIEENEKICGGRVQSIVETKSNWGRTLLLAENSAFGGGVAQFRRSCEKRYVKTIAFAAYKKEVFEKVGLYDERLVRTEDNEMHYRMKKAGYKFLLDPKIYSFRYSRNTFSKLLKQKYSNGYWIGLTMGVCPKCFSIYHLVPLVFFIFIIITTIMLLNGIKTPAIILWSMYCFAAIGMSILSTIKEKFCVYFISLPILFFLIHLYYGFGTFIGLIKTPIWLLHNKIKTVTTNTIESESNITL
ncbi:Glycosyltransferase, catalytic subunit of cellulose synthase and poly-beta-1,6-N-acetylglucosamine synthase [Clostridium cavendishii DSM 21758]|uniref:Glycosyltransferase, catalytic subunit of cellulose synthase and poly-beta-1,6-N-acetylglucosamine synthase n=1 Tax=Clostridium cavendishii DSM 21758 TaxID=1121302 RepID=A0A1M6QE47_9CLOT|nr:glycosyltransferase family 2 protein [Clostridium cavendishii]SHK18448.1 Glycosyltransferase, catalytic subunit of cellulose synthase and poly-beta-1,6-N-acetylglucosamine synthase [Clostridium cavendishii DSM 21758]